MMSPGVRRIIFGGSSLHPATRAFRALTGATDLRVVDKIVRYADGQGLLSSIRLFPFKSAQNKGTGSIVYGIGGWTSNDADLINGPIWQADGVDFDGTNDRATWDATGIAALDELYIFDIQKPSLGSLADNTRFGATAFGDIATSQRMETGINTDLSTGESLSIGVFSSAVDRRRKSTSAITWTADQKTQVVTRFASTGQLWKSKIEASYLPPFGTQDFRPSQTGYTTDDILNINALRNGASYSVFYATTRVALLACKTSLTTAQRETITDLLDEL